MISTIKEMVFTDHWICLNSTDAANIILICKQTKWYSSCLDREHREWGCTLVFQSQTSNTLFLPTDYRLSPHNCRRHRLGVIPRRLLPSPGSGPELHVQSDILANREPFTSPQAYWTFWQVKKMKSTSCLSEIYNHILGRTLHCATTMVALEANCSSFSVSSSHLEILLATAHMRQH